MLASLAQAADGGVITLLSVLALGFFVGIRHATDADHVVAVTTIVTRERSPGAAMAVGALWGVGHTLTILVVGGAIVVFGVVIPPKLGMSMEISVAAMLIVLGFYNVTSAATAIDRSAHVALHAGEQPPHQEHVQHQQHPPAGERWYARLGVTGLRPLFVGIVHGLAGSAAMALLVLATIRDVWSALLYLLVFGVGTLAGMALLTTAMAVPMVAASRRFGSLEQLLRRVAGAASIAVGLFMIYQIGFVDGLFL